jgi:hypothetical protein
MVTDLIIEKCAEAAHEMNRLYCEAKGDTSQTTWTNAPDWQRKSVVAGVKMALEWSTPEDQHKSWLAEKESTGWKYGPVKDLEKKEHPCFVPYEQLPLEQKAKDYLFIQTVRNMYATLSGMIFFSL